MRFVREKEREQITGVPKSTWYLRMKQGTAPKPHAIGPNSVAWLESDLQGWIREQIEPRQGVA